VSSPNNGFVLTCAAGLVGDCGFLEAPFDELLTLGRAAADEKELLASKEVTGDFWGDIGWPGRLFCSLTIPASPLALPVPTGDRDVAPLIGLRLLLSVLVLTVSVGGAVPPLLPPLATTPWLNLFAMSFTLPRCRDGSMMTGLALTVLIAWLAASNAGPDAALV